MEKYITLSLELHLFFSRIMKEHSLFLEAGFPSKDIEFTKEADWYKSGFEELLLDAVNISGGQIRPEVLNSGEIVTEYTLSTEEKTEKLTGIPINKNITMLEQNLHRQDTYMSNLNIENNVRQLNRKSIILLDGLIEFKERVLIESTSCNIFNANYPLLIEHIRREAILYRSYVVALEDGIDIEKLDIKEQELFWDQIMMEHAMFIRGLLDPSEVELINVADSFTKDYKVLIEETKDTANVALSNITSKTYEQTLKYRNFKLAGAKGLDNCEIKSIILPLLADHVLREANHFLRILKK